MNLDVHHIAFRSPDVDRLERFYAGVLRLDVVRRNDERGSVWLRAGSTLLMLERADPGEAPALQTRRDSLELVAFAIDARDRASWRERLAEASVSIEAETAHTLYFRDPDGRRIGVSSYPQHLHEAREM
ncbi:MAG TPA: VOC family protein [Polyangiaceae bacterium]|jgi:catechol-2,3-dioxygenase|nr:VOC family protein [Polyangiaceae bacterium]